eukprot:364531-Chlamydomonas_euryale.AAC.18
MSSLNPGPLPPVCPRLPNSLLSAQTCRTPFCLPTRDSLTAFHHLKLRAQYNAVIALSLSSCRSLLPAFLQATIASWQAADEEALAAEAAARCAAQSAARRIFGGQVNAAAARAAEEREQRARVAAAEREQIKADAVAARRAEHEHAVANRAKNEATKAELQAAVDRKKAEEVSSVARQGITPYGYLEQGQRQEDSFVQGCTVSSRDY